MANEQNSEVEDFLGSLRDKGETDPLAPSTDDPFAPTNKEEEKVEDEVEVEEKAKPVPFNRDPKVQRYIEKEISKRFAEYEPAPKEESNDSYKDVVDSFTAIIGNNTPEKVKALDALKNSLVNLDRKSAQEAIRVIEEQRNAEVQEEAEADDELMTGFENIEESFGVDLFAPENRKLKGQFIDYIRKVAPKNSEGEVVEFPDFEGTFDTFQSIRKSVSTNSRAKELASKSMERSGGEVTQQQPQGRTSWDNVGDKIRERLGM